MRTADQGFSVLTVARNLLRPRFSGEIGRKLITRLSEHGNWRPTPDCVCCCASVSSDPEQNCQRTNPILRREATQKGDKGDNENRPEILSQIHHVDLFHYDSDRSYAVRRSAMELVFPRLRQRSAVLTDDIGDNHFFRGFTAANQIDTRVFAFAGSYVGMFRVPKADVKQTRRQVW